ncbi:hypothetical protein G6F42_006256 [Rhizopus arrhizus]|nr:hypothetical protein G6F42_006256 [Rhizopus arrhizus]
MPNYNFSQLTETVMNACASVNRLCEIVKSLEARIIVEKSSSSQEQQQGSIQDGGGSSSSNKRQPRPSNTIRISKCVQILDPSIAEDAADTIEIGAKKKKLINEHVKVLRSYACAFYADLRMELIRTLGHVPMWKDMDSEIKQKYITLLEIFAKASGYDIDKCQNKWLSAALLGEQSHNDKDKHNPNSHSKKKAAGQENEEQQHDEEGALPLSDQEENQQSEDDEVSDQNDEETEEEEEVVEEEPKLLRRRPQPIVATTSHTTTRTTTEALLSSRETAETRANKRQRQKNSIWPDDQILSTFKAVSV